MHHLTGTYCPADELRPVSNVEFCMYQIQFSLGVA
jgi:hypothetical protein